MVKEAFLPGLTGHRRGCTRQRHSLNRVREAGKRGAERERQRRAEV